MSSFVEPFAPDNLDKAFIKRENKKKNDTEIKISNTPEGLFNYLTAPNIRHKVFIFFQGKIIYFKNDARISDKKYIYI